MVFPMLYSLFVQKKTPAKILDVLTQAHQEVYKNYGKEIQEDLMKVEAYAHFLTSQQSIQALKGDYEGTVKMVKDYGFKE